MWVKIAEGPSLSELAQLVADRELPKGTPVRFEMTLKYPIAHAFDMAGAELVFRPQMPEGLILNDVSSPDDKYKVLIEAEANSPTIAAVVGFVKAHWLAITLVTLGLTFLLGMIVGAVIITALLEPWALPWLTIAIIAGAVIILAVIIYFIYKRGIIPKLKGGGI